MIERVLMIIVHFMMWPLRWLFNHLIKRRLIRFLGREAAMKRAIKKAIRRHRKDKRRYRVFFIAWRYRVWNRDEIKNFKKAGVFNRYINSTNIDPHKFFDTNDINPCL